MQLRQSVESAQEAGARSGSHGYDHRESEGGNKVGVGVTTSPPAFASAPNTNPILYGELAVCHHEYWMTSRLMTI